MQVVMVLRRLFPVISGTHLWWTARCSTAASSTTCLAISWQYATCVIHRWMVQQGRQLAVNHVAMTHTAERWGGVEASNTGLCT